jgi:peroxiredoxin Q/BCP
MKMFLGKSFLGIVRCTFLIDPEGTITQMWDNVNPKGHANQVLEAIRAKQAA